MTAPPIVIPRGERSERVSFPLLVPINDSTTRMLIRTRGSGVPSLRSVVLSPPGLLIFEPAHLIMERRMLLGIKERAERGEDKTFFVAR